MKKALSLLLICGSLALSSCAPSAQDLQKQQDQQALQLAEDAILQYNIAVQSSPANAYVQAQVVAQFYLQAKDQANFEKWNAIAKGHEQDVLRWKLKSITMKYTRNPDLSDELNEIIRIIQTRAFAEGTPAFMAALEIEKLIKKNYTLKPSESSNNGVASEGQLLPDAEQCLKIQNQVKQYCYTDQDDNPVISSGGIRTIISSWKQMIG